MISMTTIMSRIAERYVALLTVPVAKLKQILATLPFSGVLYAVPMDFIFQVFYIER
jgi:hypothetical protein